MSHLLNFSLNMFSDSEQVSIVFPWTLVKSVVFPTIVPVYTELKYTLFLLFEYSK